MDETPYRIRLDRQPLCIQLRCCMEFQNGHRPELLRLLSRQGCAVLCISRTNQRSASGTQDQETNAESLSIREHEAEDKKYQERRRKCLIVLGERHCLLSAADFVRCSLRSYSPGIASRSLHQGGNQAALAASDPGPQLIPD